MKQQTIFIITFLIVSCFAISDRYSKSAMQSNETLKLSAEKNTFSVGEKVILNLEINHNGLPDSKNIRCGYLKTYVSTDNKEYKEAAIKGGIPIDECEIPLPLNENLSLKKTLLWNAFATPSSSNKSSPLFKDKITTNYVFPEPGIYFVKMRFGVIDEKIPLIESAPIQITIAEPTGKDLEVWNKIKEKGYFAYFLQESEILSSTPEERAMFQQDIKQIANQYPNSFIGSQLKQGIEKFNKSEAKRKEYLDKIKQQKP